MLDSLVRVSRRVAWNHFVNILGKPVVVTDAPALYVAGTPNKLRVLSLSDSAAVVSDGGDVISNITFVTGGTAAATPTAGFAALYSSATTPALLAQTADFGSTARAANTAYTVALATAQTITTPGVYYVVISFTAGTDVGVRPDATASKVSPPLSLALPSRALASLLKRICSSVRFSGVS